MYNPIIEMIKQAYRRFLICLARILYSRSFNYDNAYNSIAKEGLLPKENPIKGFQKEWGIICAQNKPYKEISLDKRDYVFASIKGVLLMLLALVVLALVIKYRIENPLTINQVLLGIK